MQGRCGQSGMTGHSGHAVLANQIGGSQLKCLRQACPAYQPSGCYSDHSNCSLNMVGIGDNCLNSRARVTWVFKAKQLDEQCMAVLEARDLTLTWAETSLFCLLQLLTFCICCWKYALTEFSLRVPPLHVLSGPASAPANPESSFRKLSPVNVGLCAREIVTCEHGESAREHVTCERACHV